jgi:uncharacterized protein YmfQ (DUF2313 family)
MTTTPTTTGGLPVDRHVRRSGADYAHVMNMLLPTGQAWPRDPVSIVWKVLRGLAQLWGSIGVDPESDEWGHQLVDGRAADLLERESDPRTTLELLPDWERNWGLPDPCYPDATTIGERQRMLVLQMTMLGGQSRAFFYKIANWIGHNIKITEFAPFMAGVSHVGDTRNVYDNTGMFRWYIGPPELRFYWTAHAGQAKLTWFRASSGQAGVDPHLRIGTEQDFECLLRRWKPAHTELVYDYSSLFLGGPLAGTP